MTTRDAGDVEIRYYEDPWAVGVIDAVVAASPGLSRGDLLKQIVGSWARWEAHRAKLIRRIVDGNGNPPEGNWIPGGMWGGS
jgi:hypothetical protein